VRGRGGGRQVAQALALALPLDLGLVEGRELEAEVGILVGGAEGGLRGGAEADHFGLEVGYLLVGGGKGFGLGLSGVVWFPGVEFATCSAAVPTVAAKDLRCTQLVCRTGVSADV